MSFFKKISFVFFGFFLAIISVNLVKVIRAYGENGVINACVDHKGGLRIVNNSSECNRKETFLSWSIGNSNSNPRPIGGYLQDMTNTVINNIEPRYSNLTGYLFSGSTINNSSFEASDLTGAKFIGSRLDNVYFARTNLTNADFTGAIFTSYDNNFFEGVIWSNTICPDVTNSNIDDGDNFTCLNNLIIPIPTP
jgi:hypothetical protein